MTQHRTRLLGSSQRAAGDGAPHALGGPAPTRGMPRPRAGSLRTLRYGSAVLALIAAGVATACSGSGSSSANLATGGRAGGTLTVAAPSAPSSLDPAVGQANETYSDLAYTPLIVQTSDGAYQPGLAESWSYGPDNESFTIKLRPGVKFSDGTALNAEAVKAWIAHEMKPGNGGASYLTTLKSVDVTGPLTLTLKFSSPAPDLEMVFGQILALGMIGSPRAVQAGTLAKETDGAGPYMLDTARHRFRSDLHVRAQPQLLGQVRRALVEGGRAGHREPHRRPPGPAVGAGPGGDGSAGDERSRGDEIRAQVVDPLTLLLGLGILDRDGKIDKPLGNVQVRQALNYAIDRSALAKVLGSGYGIPITQMAAPGWDSYDAALAQAYPYDPAKARQLLAAAGYPHGFTLPVVSVAAVGQDLLANALEGQLSAVGITVKPDITTNDGAYFQAMSSGTYPAATLSFGELPAAFDYEDLYGPTPPSTRSRPTARSRQRWTAG